ncbi:MAG: caspase family protein, partial [Chloroflexota bacterium]
PVADLGGCKRDIFSINQFFEHRLDKEKYQYRPLTLIDSQATRQAIIDGFQTHLAQARRGDHAIFYYSGHGSYARTPREFWHLEPDRRDETLVCHDSRTENSRDLADKELASLIHRISLNGCKVTIILDCCHSGSGTRSNTVAVRQAPRDQRERPVSSYLFRPTKEGHVYPQALGTVSAETGWHLLPKGDHVLLAACASDQTAKEVEINGLRRGIFSYFLLESLQLAGMGLTYRDLFMRVNALVKACVAGQGPQLKATRTADLEQPFLGSAIQPTPKYFTVSYDNLTGWVIDAGSVNGFVAPNQQETTRFALFPFDASPNDLKNLREAVGYAQLSKVFGTTSRLTTEAALNQWTTYKAIPVALPIKPLLIQFTGDELGLKRVRQALATYGPNLQPSLMVAETQPRETPDLALEAIGNRYLIRRIGEDDPLVTPTHGFGIEQAETVIGRLEHMARWTNLMRLSNPFTNLDTNSVQIFFEVRENNQWKSVPIDREIELHYHQLPGTIVWQKPEFRMKLVNRSPHRLFCMLLNLTEKYKVSSLTEDDGQWLDQGEEYWIFEGDILQGTVPDDFWRRGRHHFRDMLKLIVTTEASYALRLEQTDLPVRVAKTRAVPKPRAIQPDTLTRLMHRIRLRDSGSQLEGGRISDWYTLETVFTTVRPPEAKTIMGGN